MKVSQSTVATSQWCRVSYRPCRMGLKSGESLRLGAVCSTWKSEG
jgi:hypothetical protein